jgi:hypothetical protein
MFLISKNFASKQILLSVLWDLLPYSVEPMLWYLLMWKANERDDTGISPMPNKNNSVKMPNDPILIYVTGRS